MAPLLIAFIGGTGRLGAVLVQALLEAGNFNIRLILRPGTAYDSTSSKITPFFVDRTAEVSLQPALQDCDVVVNVLGDRAPIEEHFVVLRAVIAAGVKRYVPSQWGNTPNTTALGAVPFLQMKLRVNEEVGRAAQQGKITYTTIGGGPWFEYVMEYPSLMSMPQRVFTIHETPDFVFGVSSRATFGAALVSVLNHLVETENRHLNVNLALLSQNQALQLGREALPGEEVKTIRASYEKRYRSGLKRVLSGASDKLAFADVLSKCMFDPTVNVQPEHLDNDLLGIKLATDDEVRDMLRIASTSKCYESDAIAWNNSLSPEL